MENTKYNGWTNRETWLVNLWFGDNFSMDVEEGIEISAEYIQETVESYVDEIVTESASFVADMIDMGCINWNELASHYEVEE